MRLLAAFATLFLSCTAVTAQNPVDTVIWGRNPNTSYGSATSVSVDQRDGGSPTRGLLKFPNLSVDSGESLLTATLRIWSLNPSTGTVSAYRMNEPWSSSSTWSQLNNGDPRREISPSFLLTSPASGLWIESDVTNDVAAWLSNPSTNQGWIFINDSRNGWDWSTAESSNPPELVLVFDIVRPTSKPTEQPSPNPTLSEVQGPGLIIVDANFEVGTNGFIYEYDTFQNTNNPGYESGQRVSNIFNGSSGLEVTVGGIDDSTILGMSAGWAYSFILSQTSDVHVEFDWELVFKANYESDEFGEMRVSLDGDERVIHRLTGDGNGGVDSIAAGQNRIETWTSQTAGSHTVILGVYNNKKTWSDEDTRIRIDHVLITAPNGPVPITLGPTPTPTQTPMNTPMPAPSSAPTFAPSPGPTPAPTPAPVPTPNPLACPNGPASYFPGDLTVTLGGGLATSSLLVSTGLNGRVLTRAGQRVPYAGGSQSSATMHSNADGAATFPDDSNPNRYYLVSNSETTTGGVGILHFDATTTPHSVINYYRTAENTNTGSRNCGGGRTPWGTWLTSEESGTGRVWEVDPNAPPGNDHCLSPIVPSAGGNYESNAYWEATDNKFHFYTTNDLGTNYLLTRFVPVETRAQMLAKPVKLDRLCGASGTLSYLRLSCTSGCSSSTPSGTYTWVSSRSNSGFAYPNAKGIDVKGNQLYFVTKGQRRLYIVDLTSNTWRAGGTLQDGSEFLPDQLARITGSNSPDDILYFCEDGSGTQDIHARGIDPSDGLYKFFTIIQGYSSTETTGLTFSPDNKYMYFAHQGQSEIWQIWREDGCSFGNGLYLDVNYHRVSSRFLRRREMSLLETQDGE